jgi:uncharacterized alpha-E superfamily protein
VSLPLLSRVAESIYWLSRYMERADNVARFVNVNLQLILDAPAVHRQQWEALVIASGDSKPFAERYSEPSQENVIRFLMFDRQNPNSVVSCVRAARENARAIRDVITADMWAAVNRLYLYLLDPAVGRSTDSYEELMSGVRQYCQQFQGAADSSLSHGEAWQFLRLGRTLERADQTTRILDVKYFLLLPKVEDVDSPIDDIQWSAVLRSVSGLQMYRMLYGRILPLDIVEFILLDRAFPRAVRYCMESSAAALRKISAQGGDEDEAIKDAIAALESISARLDSTTAVEIVRGGLHEFIDSLQISLNDLGILISEAYFGARPVAAGASAPQ